MKTTGRLSRNSIDKFTIQSYTKIDADVYFDTGGDFNATGKREIFRGTKK